MKFIPLIVPLILCVTAPVHAQFIQVQAKAGTNFFNGRPLFVGDRMAKAGDKVSTAGSSHVNMSMPIGYLSFGNGAILSTRSLTNGAYRLAIDKGAVKVKLTQRANFEIGGTGIVQALGTEFKVTESGISTLVEVIEGTVELSCSNQKILVNKGFSAICLKLQVPTKVTPISNNFTPDVAFEDGLAILTIDPSLSLYVDDKLRPHDTKGRYVISTRLRRRLRIEGINGAEAWILKECQTAGLPRESEIYISANEAVCSEHG